MLSTIDISKILNTKDSGVINLHTILSNDNSNYSTLQPWFISMLSSGDNSTKYPNLMLSS